MRPLLFIRHAQSEMNAEGRWQGQADPPLSPLGFEQAEALAETLARSDVPQRVDQLVTSDLRRAAQTADAVGRALGIAAEPCSELRETDVGDWSGLPHAEIEARYSESLAVWKSGDEHVRPGGGESRVMVRARVCAAIARLRTGTGGAIAVVTHLGVLRTLRPGINLANAEFLWWEDGARAAFEPSDSTREVTVL